jgi:hypothetical protein
MSPEPRLRPVGQEEQRLRVNRTPLLGHGRGPRSRKALLARAHSNTAPIYWGYAAQPFSIESPTRSYPIPDVTGWETVAYPTLDVQDPKFHRFVDTSTTGSRRDFGLDSDAAPDVVTLRYEERVIAIGGTV